MIYVECKPDAALANTIGEKKIDHAGCKSEVIKRLMKTEGCVGLIDEDPNRIQPPFLVKYSLEKEYPTLEIRILRDSHRNNRLILLCPRLEEWILGAVRQSGLKLEKYDLPEDPKKFHEVVNVRFAKFNKLLEDLKAARNKKLIGLKKIIQQAIRD